MSGATTGAGDVALTVEDRAILALESDTVVGHACKVIMVGPTLRVDELQEALRGRIAAVPSLTRALGGPPDAPAWVAAGDFRLEDHLVDATGRGPLAAGELTGDIARLFTQRLDRRHPLWRIDVLGPLEDGSCALVWRIHHALADGQTSMRYATALLWDADGPGSAPESRRQAAADAERHHQRHRRNLAGFIEREFRREVGPSPFDGHIGTQRTIAFATARLDTLRRAARAVAEATVNDAVLACVAGGLRRWLGSDSPVGEVRVKVPVSMHQAGDTEGNRDSCFYLGLPLGEPDQATRLRLIRQESALRKANHDAEEMDCLLAGLSRVSPRLRQVCERFQVDPREYALNVSNVPGPPTPVSVVGRPVLAIHAIADIAERHALRVAAISYGERIDFGLCADPMLVPNLSGLAEAIQAEADDLIALVP